MTILYSYGNYGVVDSGKAGGIYASVEILDNGATRHIGNHNSLSDAQRVAQGLHALEEQAVAPVSTGTKKLFGFKLGGVQLTFTKN